MSQEQGPLSAVSPASKAKQNQVLCEMAAMSMPSYSEGDEGPLLSDRPTPGTAKQWKSRLTFILATVGAAIGLGNVWRFPYLAYKYGGGAFLFPYFLSLILVGIPLLLLEVCLGQITQKAALQALVVAHPGAWGVGLAASFTAYLISIYYSVLMAWLWIYFVGSFSDPLPWAGSIDSAEDFFYSQVLGSCQPSASCTLGSSPITLQWQPTTALAVNWIITFACVCQGASSIGKVSMVLMPVPMVLMLLLFFRTIALSGAWSGLQYYLEPDFTALGDPELWLAALSQIFFSLSLGVGVMIVYGSYNKLSASIVPETLTVGLGNSAASLFSGLVIFSALGHLATERNTPVAEVVEGGAGLVFVVFPSALSLLPKPQVFSVAFFAALISIALASVISLVESFKAVLFECFPRLALSNRSSTALLCVLGWIAGLSMTNSDGRFVLDIVDHSISTYLLIPVGIIEIILVGWHYDADYLAQQVLAHTGKHLPAAWPVAVKYVIPPLCVALILYNAVQEVLEVYGGYPWWAIAFAGWSLVILSLGIILTGALNPYPEQSADRSDAYAPEVHTPEPTVVIVPERRDSEEDPEVDASPPQSTESRSRSSKARDRFRRIDSP